MADYIDIEQASKRIGKSTRTLRRWCQSQRIPFRMDHGKYYFEVADLDARKAEDVDPLDNASLLERIETLENALRLATERLDKMEQSQAQEPITAPLAVPTLAFPTRPRALRKTRLIKNGGLPDGLIGLAEFCDLHKVAQSTAKRHVDKDLPVTRGAWKREKQTVKIALDPAQQHIFYELFAVTNRISSFTECEDCPHDTLTCL